MATNSSTQTVTHPLPEIDEDDFVIITHQEANASRRPRFLNDISDYIDSIAEELWPINKKIHDKPELGYGEVIAHYTLTAYMKTQPGWTVTRSAYGMKTAWVAVYDTGRRGPCVSFNVEMGMSSPSSCHPESPESSTHTSTTVPSTAGINPASSPRRHHVTLPTTHSPPFQTMTDTNLN